MKLQILTTILLAAGCQKPADPAPEPAPLPNPVFEATAPVPVTPGLVDEASGIAYSNTTANALWVQQDGGNGAALTLLGTDGKLIRKVDIEGVANRDWEDMAIAAGPTAGTRYVYVGEIGDNNAVHPSVSFIRFPEPGSSTTKVTNPDVLPFTYSDGPRDAEAFFVDPKTNDIYIITKREAQSRLYKLAHPQATTGTGTAQFVSTLPFNSVVSAALSPDGKELIVKTYAQLMYWKIDGEKSFADLLQTKPFLLPYTIEPQGEAVCFRNDGGGYFTLSEKAAAPQVNLYFYKRK